MHELAADDQQDQQTRVPERFAVSEAEVRSPWPWSPLKVPHVPWTPAQTKQIDEVDENAWVYNVPIDGRHRSVQFQRTKWPFGGHITTATCQCRESHEAGGAAGERNLKLWAERHDCKAIPAQFEPDEDQKLFRH